MSTTDSLVDAILQETVQALVERFRPARVVLFGSYAYGEPHRDSDLDILVVMPSPPPRREAWAIAGEIGRELPISLQLQFMSPEEFDETKDVVGGLAYPAHHWGRILHEAQPRSGDLGLRAGMAREGRGRSTLRGATTSRTRAR